MPAPLPRTAPIPSSPLARRRCRSRTRSRARPPSWILALFVLVLMPVACDPGFPGPGEGETISEEAFVETMVELRRGAAQWEMRRLPVEVRDSILESRNLTPEDLLEFVEVHGTDVLYMNRIWTLVEARLTGRDLEALQADVPEAAELVEEGFLPRDAVPDLPDPDDPDDPGPGMDRGMDGGMDPDPGPGE